MIFNWLKAENFLSIGSDGIHLDFKPLGDIVLVKGKNLDISPTASNGAGKSTILEVVVYSLFGKLIKDLSHKQAINNKVKKGLKIEICFEINGHEYIVKRGRKPDYLHLFKDGEDVTLGGMPDTQKEIENIVRLNFESFINVVCFGEHNNHSFLSCDAATKRVIVENLLGLEKYLKYCKTAKECLKSVNERLIVLRKQYELHVDQRDSLSARLESLYQKQSAWIKTKQGEVDQLRNAIAGKESEISTTFDVGEAILAYQQAQQRIEANKSELVKCEENRVKISSLVDEIKSRLDRLQESKNTHSIKCKEKESEITTLKSEISTLERQNQKLSSLQPGVKCSACYGTVDQKNYDHMILHNHDQISQLKKQIESLMADYKTLEENRLSVINNIETINNTKTQADARLSQINNKMRLILSAIQTDSKIKEPQANARALVLAEQLAELKRQLTSRLDELDNHDPYVEIIAKSSSDVKNLCEKIEELKIVVAENEAEIPYYEFWIEGFGDDGIRAYVIDEILPALNARINYWLQFLIDNKIQLHFDNKFQATIERNPLDGDPFVYNATSGGERRRINLAISQAFAHVMMISSGTSPSFIYLDEVALNVDVDGVHGIFNMINELSRDRQVFVTTHDPNLNDLLQSCKTITVIKQDGFSTLVA